MCLLAGVQVSQQVWGLCLAWEQVCLLGCHCAFSTLDSSRLQVQWWGQVVGSPAGAKVLDKPILIHSSSEITSTLPPWGASAFLGTLQFDWQQDAQVQWLGGWGFWLCPWLSSAPLLRTSTFSSCLVRVSLWVRITSHLAQSFTPMALLRVVSQRCF